MGEQESFSFNFKAGWSSRKHMVKSLRYLAGVFCLEIEVQEDKRWLDSDFRIRVTGESKEVWGFAASVAHYQDADLRVHLGDLL